MTNLENELQNFKHKIQTATQLIEELEQSNRNSTEGLKRLEDIDNLVKSIDTNSKNFLETIENRFIQVNEELKNETNQKIEELRKLSSEIENRFIQSNEESKKDTNQKIEELRKLASEIENRYKELIVDLETNTKENIASIEETYKKLIDQTNDSFKNSTIGLEKEVNFTRETLRNLVSLYESSNRNILEIQNKLNDFNTLMNVKIDKLEKKFTSLVMVIGIMNMIIIILSILLNIK